MDITYVEFSPYGEEPTGYKATIDGEIMSVPLDPGNGYYDAIQEAIADGLVVQPASDPLTPEQRQEIADREAARESAIAKLVSVLGLTTEEQSALGF